MPRAILIAGPTASGKSALALTLAEHYGGTVVNADSMQVYRELSVLTARPTPENEARVPHALYGFVPGREAYSAGRFMTDAKRAIEHSRASGRVPIFVGGTGLYFKVLLEGLSPVPPVPPGIRRHWRTEAGNLGAARLYDVLAARDPEMAARLKPTDPQRIARALEVLDATGRSLALWQREPGVPVLREAETIRLVVASERDETKRRCGARFDAMMERGALDEVARLRALDLDPDLPVMRALGVMPLLAHLGGTLDLGTAVANAKAETCQYAKRQLVWLKRHMISWKTVVSQQTELQLPNLFSFIDQSVDATVPPR